MTEERAPTVSPRALLAAGLALTFAFVGVYLPLVGVVAS